MEFKAPKYKYTLSQKIIFTAIACIVVSSIIFNKFYSGSDGNTFKPDSALIAQVKAFEDSLEPVDTTYYHNNYRSVNRNTDSPLPPRRIFSFNPNETDSFGLLELGFKPFMAHNILQYRRRGGRINNEQKFKQIFNIDTALITEIRPFTLYPTPETTADSTRTNNRKHYFTFDLNAADTLTLSQLPGIGIGRAKMIVNYRRKLGGYSQAQQLLEIKEIPDSITKPLMQYAKTSTDSLKPIKVNKSNIHQLRRHPYINYEQAKELYNLRWDQNHRGTLKKEDIKQLHEFTPEELKRLLPYLDFSSE